MAYVNKYNPKLKNPRNVADLYDMLQDMHHAVNKELSAIQNAGTSGTTVTRVISSGGSSGGGSMGGSIVVEYPGLGTIIPNVATLQFNDTNGFTLTSPASGIARIGFDIASSPLHRCGESAVTTAGTTVSFSSALSSPVVLPLRCVNASGVVVGVSITDVTETGFVANPVENGTLTWMAQPDWLPRMGVARVIQGGTTVPLPIAYADTSYGIELISCKNASGVDVGFDISAKAADSFMCDPIEEATLVFRTYKYV